MSRTRRYEVDGLVIDIPLVYDTLADMDIEDYPNFKSTPIYTPNGHPLTVGVMDACRYASPAADDTCIDCSDCAHFRRAAERTLFGICLSDQADKVFKRKSAVSQE